MVPFFKEPARIFRTWLENKSQLWFLQLIKTNKGLAKKGNGANNHLSTFVTFREFFWQSWTLHRQLRWLTIVKLNFTIPRKVLPNPRIAFPSMDRFSQKIVAKVVSREGFSKNAIVTGHTRRVTSSYHVANCSNSRTEGLADFRLLVPILCPHVILKEI